MDNIKYLILGAGVSGIGAQYSLGNDSYIFERKESSGGLCDNFSVQGFLFDYAVHLSFTKNENLQKMLYDETECCHEAISYNYYNGVWIKHPAQNNLFPLNTEEKIKIIEGFVNRREYEVDNYKDWLINQYGDYFANHFPLIYTKKYWGTDACNLSVNWIGNRMYKPSLVEVLKGSFENETPNTYYTKEMKYPFRGGFKNFFSKYIDDTHIKYSKNLSSVDLNNKIIYFSDGTEYSYTSLINSIPLPEFVKKIKNCPSEVLDAAKKLKATSIALVSVGFKCKIEIPSIWFYVYDEQFPFARVHSPSRKSINNAPSGMDSLEFECYYSEENDNLINKEEIIEKVKEAIVKMNIAKLDDVLFYDYRIISYANVIFYKGMEKNRQIVIDYLSKYNVKCIGRFGLWDYLWSDQAFLSGLNVSKE